MPEITPTLGLALSAAVSFGAAVASVACDGNHGPAIRQLMLGAFGSSAGSSRSKKAILDLPGLGRTAASRLLLSTAATAVAATYVRWLLMVPPQRTPTPKEVARAVAAGAPIAPLDPRMLLSAQQMSQDLRAGKYTSVELVELFIAHIERVDRRAVNAVVWRRFDEARAEARRADEILADARAGRRDWTTVGWLTGVPCSMKETFAVTGCSNCVGHPMRHPEAGPDAAKRIAAAGHPPPIAEEDAEVVARLRQFGAIILGLTNASELAMWLESNNHVYGYTCNPYDARCLVGGSSGGEAAAMAAIYAPVGTGSDIGGSIRLPSMFCGTFGHKPSTRLVPNRGMFPGPSGYGHFMVGTGPMVRHVEDLWPMLATLAQGGYAEDAQLYAPCPGMVEQLHRQHEHERALKRIARVAAASGAGGAGTAPPSPIPSSTLTSPLSQQLVNFSSPNCASFGSPVGARTAMINLPRDIPMSSVTVYAVEDLNLPLTWVEQDQRLAVRRTAEAFCAATGAKLHVVDWSKPETIPKGWDRFRRALRLWATGMTTHGDYCELLGAGYPEDKPYRVFGELGKWLVGRSRHTLPSIVLGVIEAFEHAFVPRKVNAEDMKSIDDLAADVNDLLGLRGVMICPGFPHVASKHHAAKLLRLSFTYTALFNTLQLPITSVPVWGHLPTAPESQRLPCGVQVIGSYGNDVLTIAVAEAMAKHTPYCHVKVPDWMTVMPSVPVV